MVPLAPGLFSTTTVWRHCWLSSWASWRARMSVVPPGGKGTTRVTLRVGKGWRGSAWLAGAARAAARASAAAAACVEVFMFVSCVVFWCVGGRSDTLRVSDTWQTWRACLILGRPARRSGGGREFDHGFADRHGFAALVGDLHVQRGPLAFFGLARGGDGGARGDGVARLDRDLPAGFQAALHAALRVEPVGQHLGDDAEVVHAVHDDAAELG